MQLLTDEGSFTFAVLDGNLIVERLVIGVGVPEIKASRSMWPSRNSPLSPCGGVVVFEGQPIAALQDYADHPYVGHFLVDGGGSVVRSTTDTETPAPLGRA